MMMLVKTLKIMVLVKTMAMVRRYVDVDEDGSKSALIDQVCAYLTTGKYKDS